LKGNLIEFQAYGSALFYDGQIDYRTEFSKFFMSQFTLVKFPTDASVFDIWVDPTTSEFSLWTEMVPKFELDPDIPLQACLVHNSETIRIKYEAHISYDSLFNLS
jgi:dynein heavy chain